MIVTRSKPGTPILKLAMVKRLQVKKFDIKKIPQKIRQKVRQKIGQKIGQKICKNSSKNFSSNIKVTMISM